MNSSYLMQLLCIYFFSFIHMGQVRNKNMSWWCCVAGWSWTQMQDSNTKEITETGSFYLQQQSTKLNTWKQNLTLETENWKLETYNKKLGTGEKARRSQWPALVLAWCGVVVVSDGGPWAAWMVAGIDRDGNPWAVQDWAVQWPLVQAEINQMEQGPLVEQNQKVQRALASWSCAGYTAC